jgi:hypothetical protein
MPLCAAASWPVQAPAASRHVWVTAMRAHGTRGRTCASSAHVCADANLAQIWAKDGSGYASVRLCCPAREGATHALVRSDARGLDALAPQGISSGWTQQARISANARDGRVCTSWIFYFLVNSDCKSQYFLIFIPKSFFSKISAKVFWYCAVSVMFDIFWFYNDLS